MLAWEMIASPGAALKSPMGGKMTAMMSKAKRLRFFIEPASELVEHRAASRSLPKYNFNRGNHAN